MTTVPRAPGRPKGAGPLGGRRPQAASGEPHWRREERDHLVLVLHVQPGASRTEVAGVHGDALKVRLAAPPAEGRANAALVAFLADAFGVPRAGVALLRGATSRRKSVRIDRPAKRPDIAWAADAPAE